jgi:hypothetical protein
MEVPPDQAVSRPDLTVTELVFQQASADPSLSDAAADLLLEVLTYQNPDHAKASAPDNTSAPLPGVFIKSVAVEGFPAEGTLDSRGGIQPAQVARL